MANFVCLVKNKIAFLIILDVTAGNRNFPPYMVKVEIPRPDAIDDIGVYIATWKKIRAELERSIEGISEERFVQPLADKSWSASEIVEHLALSQSKFARVIPMVLKGRFGAASVGGVCADYNRIEGALRATGKINNPEAVSPVNPSDKTQSRTLLNEAMALFEKNILAGDPASNLATLKKYTLEHFVFGPLNLAEYTWVLVLHEIHHLILLQQKYLRK